MKKVPVVCKDLIGIIQKNTKETEARVYTINDPSNIKNLVTPLRDAAVGNRYFEIDNTELAAALVKRVNLLLNSNAEDPKKILEAVTLLYKTCPYSEEPAIDIQVTSMLKETLSADDIDALYQLLLHWECLLLRHKKIKQLNPEILTQLSAAWKNLASRITTDNHSDNAQKNAFLAHADLLLGKRIEAKTTLESEIANFKFFGCAINSPITQVTLLSALEPNQERTTLIKDLEQRLSLQTPMAKQPNSQNKPEQLVVIPDMIDFNENQTNEVLKEDPNTVANNQTNTEDNQPSTTEIPQQTTFTPALNPDEIKKYYASDEFELLTILSRFYQKSVTNAITGNDDPLTFIKTQSREKALWIISSLTSTDDLNQLLKQLPKEYPNDSLTALFLYVANSGTNKQKNNFFNHISVAQKATLREYITKSNYFILKVAILNNTLELFIKNLYNLSDSQSELIQLGIADITKATLKQMSPIDGCTIKKIFTQCSQRAKDILKECFFSLLMENQNSCNIELFDTDLYNDTFFYTHNDKLRLMPYCTIEQIMHIMYGAANTHGISPNKKDNKQQLTDILQKLIDRFKKAGNEEKILIRTALTTPGNDFPQAMRALICASRGYPYKFTCGNTNNKYAVEKDEQTCDFKYNDFYLATDFTLLINIINNIFEPEDLKKLFESESKFTATLFNTILQTTQEKETLNTLYQNFVYANFQKKMTVAWNNTNLYNSAHEAKYKFFDILAIYHPENAAWLIDKNIVSQDRLETFSPKTSLSVFVNLDSPSEHIAKKIFTLYYILYNWNEFSPELCSKISDFFNKYNKFKGGFLHSESKNIYYVDFNSHFEDIYFNITTQDVHFLKLLMPYIKKRSSGNDKNNTNSNSNSNTNTNTKINLDSNIESIKQLITSCNLEEICKILSNENLVQEHDLIATQITADIVILLLEYVKYHKKYNYEVISTLLSQGSFENYQKLLNVLLIANKVEIFQDDYEKEISPNIIKYLPQKLKPVAQLLNYEAQFRILTTDANGVIKNTTHNSTLVSYSIFNTGSLGSTTCKLHSYIVYKITDKSKGIFYKYINSAHENRDDSYVQDLREFQSNLLTFEKFDKNDPQAASRLNSIVSYFSGHKPETIASTLEAKNNSVLGNVCG